MSRLVLTDVNLNFQDEIFNIQSELFYIYTADFGGFGDECCWERHQKKETGWVLIITTLIMHARTQQLTTKFGCWNIDEKLRDIQKE